MTAPIAPNSPASLPAAPLAAVSNQLIARIGVQADLTDEALLPRGPQRKQAVYDDLVKTAAASQQPAMMKLEELRRSGAVTAVESMFLPNALVVTSAPGKEQAVADALRGVANITEVAENKKWSIPGAPDGPAGSWDAVTGGTSLAPVNVAWGVEKIGAPAAWARHIDGTGVTIGIVDTGLDAAHPAIKGHYRGTAADGSQTHDYNWFDPFNNRAVPFDDGGHGTHVGGTSAGGVEGQAIGVAPGAKLIAAKAIEGAGNNTSVATMRALQWMLAPTRTDGTSPDPTRGADVVNNSWGNADQNDASFQETFAGLLAAGIEVVTAAGNDGPGAGTVSPPGSYPGYISVAATNRDDKVTSFSSRGPSKFAKAGELVPNIAGPGASVPSAVPGGRYQSMSGTSMASPHLAGVVALLLQAKPQATHAEILEAMNSTAVDIDRPGPDTAAGNGRVDVIAAIDQLNTTKEPTPKYPLALPV
ncbi:MAG: serine protease [Thermoleophilia bacterium]|nr:serine protease [Thermoleophilia bacterium]MCZ4495545.1 serine protease [Thermoleophilia bacterium]